MTIADTPSPMTRALAQARRAAAIGEVPVGAVICSEGKIIARAHNMTRTQNDPTAHAEILALRAAAEKLGNARLTACDLYVTLEPCAMCAGAIIHARIRRLYYAAADPKGGAVENGARLFAAPEALHRPEIYSGIAAREAADMLQAFFQKRRT